MTNKPALAIGQIWHMKGAIDFDYPFDYKLKILKVYPNSSFIDAEIIKVDKIPPGSIKQGIIRCQTNFDLDKYGTLLDSLSENWLTILKPENTP